MNRLRRQHRFLRIFWGLMALYLFNISVDSEGLSAYQYTRDLEFNDQESFIEMLVEKVMGYENALVEFEESNGTDLTNKGSMKTKYAPQRALKLPFSNAYRVVSKSVSLEDQSPEQSGYPSDFSPPPEFII